MKGSRILPPILLLAVLLQAILLYVAHFPQLRTLKGDEGRYQMKALQIASGTHPDPDFLWPPLYQRIVGGIYSVFGVVRLPVEIFQSLLFFLTGYIFYRLILYTGLGEWAAGVALFLFWLDPQLASFAQYLWPEIVHLFFVFMMLGLLFLMNRRRMMGLFGAGLSLGAAILTKSLMAPFAPILILTAAFRASDTSAAGRFKAALTFALGVSVLVMPLVFYNGVRYGFWGVSDAAAFNLWLGWKGDLYAAEKFDEYQKYSKNSAERNRILRERVLRKIGEQGIWNYLSAQMKRQYFRLLNKDSFLTEQFPGRKWAAANEGTAGWLTHFLTWWSYAIYTCTLFLAAVGLFQMRWPADFKRCVLPALFIFYNMSLFLFFYVKTRYRVPIMPAFMFFAALGVYYFLAGFKESGSYPKPGFRFAAGCILATLLLYLAFTPGPI